MGAFMVKLVAKVIDVQIGIALMQNLKIGNL
jgi:hypothetical protein